jgi:Flp pilus assembly CpaF family ATPase
MTDAATTPDLSSLPLLAPQDDSRPPRIPVFGGVPDQAYETETQQRPQQTMPASYPPAGSRRPPENAAPRAAQSQRAMVAQDSSIDERELWQRANRLRNEVSARMSTALADRMVDVAEREDIGRRLIMQVVQDEADAELEQGRRGWTPTYSSRLTQALFDAIFRLGRLQKLVEMEDVENIEITGCDEVMLLSGNGDVRYADPIADSDAELIEYLQFLATRDPDNERSFTRSNWSLDLDLPGRARLGAVGWVVPRPHVTIRLQRLKEVDLASLRAHGTIDSVLEQFLGAAVRARCSIVVSGQGQGSGKTTLLRGLCSAIPPMEKIATIETDYELYLHAEPEKHRRVVAARAKTGSGEILPNGRRAGSVTTTQLIPPALRLSIDRIIVGEVRGDEITAMFQAMQMGNGSLSTVHADSAEDVVDRLVGLALADPSLTETYAYRQIVQTIDLIVYVSVDIDENGAKDRYVSKVIEVSRGEHGNPVAITPIFEPGPTGRAVPANPPSFLDVLVRNGFDQALLSYRAGTWGHP